MICKICKSEEEKLKLMPCTNMTFIDGRANFKSSTWSDYISTDGHKGAMKEENHEDVISVGSLTRPEKKIYEVPTYSAIGSGFRKKTEKERIGQTLWYTHYIPVKGRAFTDFEDLIELEKLQIVKFKSGSYENESGCKDFIRSIAEYFFKQDIYRKLVRVNFIAILCDGTTDANITEQEVVCFFRWHGKYATNIRTFWMPWTWQQPRCYWDIWCNDCHFSETQSFVLTSKINFSLLLESQ